MQIHMLLLSEDHMLKKDPAHKAKTNQFKMKLLMTSSLKLNLDKSTF